MSEDTRAIARRLMSGASPVAGGGTAVASPVARPATRRRIEELPQVAASLARDAELEAGLALMGGAVPNPYYLPHDGVNEPLIQMNGREMLNFGSYNYLGLAGDPRVQQAAKDAVDRYGTSASAARLIGGELPVHRALEERLRDSYGVDDAMVTGSGYLTNAAVIGWLLGEGDLAVCDSLVHNSIVAGTQLSGSRRVSFRHNDPEALEVLLQRTRSHFGQALVILEGVYSLDGDIARLPELIAIARKYDCFVMVDEAHSFGVLGGSGRGIREHLGVDGRDVDVWMGTLSKSLASYGGFLAGSAGLIQALKMAAPGLSLYAAAPPPAAMAAAIAAFDLMLAEPERLVRLRANGAEMFAAVNAAGLDTGPAEAGTPIIPVIIGPSRDTMQACLMLLQQGIHTTAILWPGVPEGEARLRFFLTADHTSEQITTTVEALAGCIGFVRSARS